MPVAKTVDLAGRGQVGRQAQNVGVLDCKGLEGRGIGAIDHLNHQWASSSIGAMPSSAAIEKFISARSSSDLKRT